MKPTLHMIYGYLGSGKTTFAKKLELEKNAVRLCTDELMVRLFGPTPTEEEMKVDSIITDMNYQLTARLLDLGIDVVMDHGFWSRASRNRARVLARKHGATAKLYYMDTPDDVALARVLQRSESLDGDTFFIDENAYKVLKVRHGFEALGADEEHVVIDDRHPA
jgi:predicted kinase